MTFDLPSKDTTEASVKMYVDGIESSHTFLSGGGQGGSDRVTMDVAPATGKYVTAEFEGKLRLYARFAQDNLSKNMFFNLVYSSTFDIVEVRQ